LAQPATFIEDRDAEIEHSKPQQPSHRIPSAIIEAAPVVSFHIRAEVVELADTPSTHIALAILYKLLIINLLPFASIASGNVPRNGQ
jgi:hypothetical protein